jgi:tetratricopeptide (TPR) repeat protein
MRLVIATAVLAVLANAALADGKQERRAKRHLTKATQAYQAKRYEEAIKEFTLAYSLDPQPQLLFALGKLNAQVGKCDAAIPFFEKYLETKPDEAATAATNEALAACGKPKTDEAEIEMEPAKPEPAGPPAAQAADDSDLPPGITSPPPKPKPVAREPAAVAPTDAGERAWYTEPVGMALVGGGAVALIGGGVLYQLARGKLDDAAQTPGYEDAIGLVDDAHRLRTYSLVSAGLGVALLGGGGYYYLRMRGGREARVSVKPTPRGAIIGVAGRF